MRTDPSEADLRKWLLEIGEGRYSPADLQQGRPTNLLRIPTELVARQLSEVIDFCFPPALFTDPLKNVAEMARHAILCPTNKEVARINDIALEQLVGTARSFLSIDVPLDQTEEFGTFHCDSNIEAINNETPNGLPSHRLVLKVCFRLNCFPTFPTI